MTVIRSVYSDQNEILKAIQALHVPDGFECDVTYGNGGFYSGIEPPLLKFDIDPQKDDVVQACSTTLPLQDGSIKSLVFDPPFLTYIRDSRTGNGNMALAKRFSGYWRYEELEDHYMETAAEAGRVLCKGGVFVVKCQDIIHNHRIHCTHAKMIEWANDCGFRLLDLYVLTANHRMPSPNRAGKQKHARIFHCYFLVFKKL